MTKAGKLADKEISCGESIDVKLVKEVWKQGFKTAQSLNDKRFSLEDMGWAITQAYLSGVERNNYGEQLKNDIIQSLQQTSWQVEVEKVTMNKGYTDKDDFPYQECKIPKITNNSIKVTKIL